MKRILFGLAIAAGLLASGTAHAQFTMVKNVVGNGGSPSTNGTFVMNGTVGQAAIGFVTNTTFTHGIGFWYPTETILSVDATPGYAADGNVLFQNFPNPFRSTTAIRFHLAQRADVVLRVFNTPGQEVAVLANGPFEAGDHEVNLAKDLPSGTYFYQMTVGTNVLRRQMVVAQ
jgi:hypothetical protein